MTLLSQVLFVVAVVGGLFNLASHLPPMSRWKSAHTWQIVSIIIALVCLVAGHQIDARLKAPRHLSPAQVAQITKDMKPFARRYVAQLAVEWTPSTKEARDFAHQFSGAAAAAGWQASTGQLAAGAAQGLVLVFNPLVDSSQEVALILMSSFRKCHIVAEGPYADSTLNSSIGLVVGDR
jgi:O-succinylbenzoate synthase